MRNSCHSPLRLFLTGIGMGCADLIPGVSGGTIAFLSGIYEELVDSIRKVSGPALSSLLRGNVRHAAREVPWKVLVPIAVGILSAVFLFAHAVSWALEHHAELVWAFFFGLVAASALVMRKRVRNPLALNIVVGFVIATVGAYVLSGLVPMETAATPLQFFASGAVAASAMILPGISGSFLLVFLGKSQQVLAAVTERDAVTLLIFGAGVIIGLMLFAHLLSILFRRYHDIMIATLTGLMVGSLRRVWPWKEYLGETEVGRNMLPEAFDWQFAGALLMIALGIGIVVLLDRLRLMEAHHHHLDKT